MKCAASANEEPAAAEAVDMLWAEMEQSCDVWLLNSIDAQLA